MSFSRGPATLTDNLVFMVDPLNTKSYIEPNTSTNSLVGDYTGSFINEPTYSEGAFNLDGTNDYISFGNILNINQFPDGITLSSWIKTTESQVYATIIGKAFYGSKAGRYSLHVYNGKIGILFHYSSINITILTNETFNDGNWHNVVCTVGADGSKIYVDGVKKLQDNRSALPSPTDETTDNFTLGYYNYNSAGYFGGLISTSCVYNKVLSLEEIQQNYNALKGRFGL